jgi:hypothetical protein
MQCRREWYQRPRSPKVRRSKNIPHGLNGDNQARIFVGGEFSCRRTCVHAVDFAAWLLGTPPNQLEPVIAAAPVADLWKKLRRSGSSSVADPAIIRGWLRASAPP